MYSQILQDNNEQPDIVLPDNWKQVVQIIIVSGLIGQKSFQSLSWCEGVTANFWASFVLYGSST